MPEQSFLSLEHQPLAESGLGLEGALVLGAPLSGKTARLRKTVQELEISGVKPSEILVLTPSRISAALLRDQISLDSHLAAASPRARSVASFAYELVSGESQLRLLSGASQERLVRRLVEDAISDGRASQWNIPRASALLPGFIQELRDLMAVLIENQQTEADLAKLASRFPKLRLAPALDILTRYREELAASGYLDPSQLLVAAMEKITPEIPCRFVFVDDAQQLSEAGLKLVEKLLEGRTGFLFGDPDSATLSFRSSSPNRFIEIARAHSLAEVNLQPRDMGDARSRLLAKLASRLPAALAGQQRYRSAGEGEIKARIFSSTSEESDALATTLRKKHIAEKVSWSEMTVVARTRTQLEQLANELSARSVPVRIIGVQRSLSQQPMALGLIDFVLVAKGNREPDLLQRLVTSPLVGLTKVQLRKLHRELASASGSRSNRDEALVALFEGESNFDHLPGRMKKLIGLLTQAAEARSSYEVVSIGWQLADTSLATLARGGGPASQAANRSLDAALELFAAALRWDEREEGTPREFAEAQLDSSVPEDSLAPIGQRQSVTLATPAQLEGSYAFVAMPRLQEGIWPNLNPRNSLLGASSLQAHLLGRLEDPTQPLRSELADELRMFYKACGASHGELWLSATEAQDEQPSQFLAMIGADLVRTPPEATFDIRHRVGRLRAALRAGDESAAATLAALALAGVPGAHPRNWQGLHTQTAALSKPNSLSASKLEAFETCPLHWFATSFGADSSGFQASIGTLLHEAMELSKNPDDVTPFVSENWHSLEFETQWEAEREFRQAAQMAAALSSYLRDASPLVASEQGFRIEIGSMSISGKIDRIEKGPDGYEVVDLKTGSTPTKDAALTNRQLAVYQLAIESLHSEPAAGARIVGVKGGSLKQLHQPPLTAELRGEISNLLLEIEKQITSGQFVANVSEHCGGSKVCKLLLTRAVTDA